ncbi:MBL fold metallo-hydrolase [Xanthomonas citri pv. mangiferaeindicae]|nr:MBL fold metallo-hydrolase [Xanthomonas citri pv. mangiferaeindicae]
MSLSRTPLAAALMAAVLLQFPVSPAQADPPSQLMQQQAGGYRVRIGEVNVTALTDGTVAQDLHQLLQGTTPQDIDDLLARNFERNPIEVSINVFLVELPGHHVLVDTGAGQVFGPGNGGRLIESLAAQGLRPEDVTDVLLTHAHSDHAAGLVRDGERVFPNAVVHVGKPDVDFFFDDDARRESGYDVQYFEIARMTLKPYLEADQVAMFSGTQQVLPGITGTVHPGHTPGSAFYRLDSAGESVTFVGDLIHAAAVQFPKPGVTIAYDQDPAGAKSVRQGQFATFARERTLIAAPHLPFPGIGHVRAGVDGGYDWVPITYTNRQDP